MRRSMCRSDLRVSWMGVLRFAELGSSSGSKKIGCKPPRDHTCHGARFAQKALRHAILFHFAVQPPHQR